MMSFTEKMNHSALRGAVALALSAGALCAHAAPALGLRDVVQVGVMPANNSSAVHLDLNVADRRDTVNIGDSIAFCFKSDKAGYVSLWDIGTSGKVSKIYPFKGESAVREVTANREECVGNTRYKVTGPTGTENVVLYWTRNPDAQIEAANYRSSREFVTALEESAKEAVRSGSWDDWATQNVSFEILSPGQSENTVSIGDIARTDSRYDNVYVAAFGANVDGLKKTNDDARLFTEMAKSSFNIPAANIRLYPDAYRKDFEEAFEWLKQKAGPNDLVLTFYSGHGTTLPDDNGDEADGLDEALVPFDVESLANRNRPEKYIRDDELRKWLDGIHAGAVVSLFDSCYSGGMYKGFSQGALLNARSKFFNKGEIAGKLPQYQGGRKAYVSRDILDEGESPLGNGKTKYAMLSASQELEYALEIPDAGGMFTLALHDALQRDGQSKDWAEAGEILSRNVVRASQSRQTPTAVDPDNALSELKLNR